MGSPRKCRCCPLSHLQKRKGRFSGRFGLQPLSLQRRRRPRAGFGSGTSSACLAAVAKPNGVFVSPYYPFGLCWAFNLANKGGLVLIGFYQYSYELSRPISYFLRTFSI
jgi:hypothetical protein